MTARCSCRKATISWSGFSSLVRKDHTNRKVAEQLWRIQGNNASGIIDKLMKRLNESRGWSEWLIAVVLVESAYWEFRVAASQKNMHTLKLRL